MLNASSLKSIFYKHIKKIIVGIILVIVVITGIYIGTRLTPSSSEIVTNETATSSQQIFKEVNLSEAKEGKRLPQKFPTFLPIPLDKISESYNSYQNPDILSQGTVVYITEEGAEKTIEGLVESLNTNGFSVSKRSKSDVPLSFSGTNDNQQIKVWLYPVVDSSAIKVSITSILR